MLGSGRGGGGGLLGGGGLGADGGADWRALTAKGVIGGGAGFAAVEQSPELGSKHPDGWTTLVVELTKFPTKVGPCTNALIFVPGSMEGPPGKQLASSGNCAT